MGSSRERKGTIGWCHGFKLHLLCNDSGEVITFFLTGPTWMTGCGMYLQRCSMERSLLTEGILSKKSSKVYSLKVSNSFMA